MTSTNNSSGKQRATASDQPQAVGPNGPVFKYFQVNKEDFVKWFVAVKRLQNLYARHPATAQYILEKIKEHEKENIKKKKSEDYEALVHHICETVYCWRGEEDRFAQYDIDEISHARAISTTIQSVDHVQKTKKTDVTTIFLSILTQFKGELRAAELPVFMVVSNESTTFVDTNCETYGTVNEMIHNIGCEFQGVLVYPKDIKNRALHDGDGDLFCSESPGCVAGALRNSRTPYIFSRYTIRKESVETLFLLPVHQYYVFVMNTLKLLGHGAIMPVATSLALSRIRISVEMNELHNRYQALLITDMRTACDMCDIFYSIDRYTEKMEQIRKDPARHGRPTIVMEMNCLLEYMKKMEKLEALLRASIFIFYKHKSNTAKPIAYLIPDVHEWNQHDDGIKSLRLKQGMKLIKAELKTAEAKKQLEMIREENSQVDDLFLAYRNLAKIADKQHFLHATYNIFVRRPESSVRNDVQGSSSIAELNTSFKDMEITDKEPRVLQSGLRFTPDYIIINESLKISAECYNTVGVESLQSAIAPLLRKGFNKWPIHDKFQKAAPEARLKDYYAELKSRNVDKYGSQSSQFWEDDNLQPAAIRVNNAVDDIAASERESAFINLQKNVLGTELVTSTHQRHIQVAELNESIKSCGPYRKEDLLRATIAAREFADAMELYTKVFEEEHNPSILDDVEEVRSIMYASARNDKPGKKGAAKVDAVRERAADAVRDLEEKAAKCAEWITFSNAQFERLSFKYHEAQISNVLARAFTINGMNAKEHPIFQNMTIADYDRLRRVIESIPQSKSPFEKVVDCVALCKEDAVLNYVKTPADFACLIEMRNLDVTTSEELLRKIKEIEAVPSKLEWSSILSKTYHFFKHQKEFVEGGVECSDVDYFNKHADNLFTPDYKFSGKLYTQLGVECEVYNRVLSNTKTHVGFAAADLSKINSHFINVKKL